MVLEIMDQDWAGLQEHLLVSILEKLKSWIDFLRFGTVCVSWHSLIKDKHIKQSKIFRHHYVPMLLFPSEEENTWSIYNVIDENFLDLKLSLLYNKRFSGFSQGWLVVVNEDYTVTLHRPYFKSKGDTIDINTSVQLPCLFPPKSYDPLPEEDDYESIYEGCDYHIVRALIIGDPLKNPKDCIVIVIYSLQYKLASIRYGKDTTWTKIKSDQFRFYRDLVHYKNQVYSLDCYGKLVSFDPCNATIKLVAPQVEHLGGPMNSYLVVSCGELLNVERYIYFSEDCSERMTKMFRVFKMDFGEAKWIEKRSLDDVALFIGDNSCISILAVDFKIQANCIHFTHDVSHLPTPTKESCDVGVYDMKTASIKLHYNLDSTSFHRIYKRAPIWIAPPTKY